MLSDRRDISDAIDHVAAPMPAGLTVPGPVIAHQPQTRCRDPRRLRMPSAQATSRRAVNHDNRHPGRIADLLVAQQPSVAGDNDPAAHL